MTAIDCVRSVVEQAALFTVDATRGSYPLFGCPHILTGSGHVLSYARSSLSICRPLL